MLSLMLTMVRCCLSLLLCLITMGPAFGQQDTSIVEPRHRFDLSKEHWELGVKLGAGINGTWEVGLMRYNWTGVPFGLATYGFSNEFVHDGRLFNPKITAEFSWYVAGARLSVIDYNNWHTHEIRLRPEIGFTLLGIVTVFYGWDMRLTDTLYESVPLNRWHIGLNLPFEGHRKGYF